MRDKDIAKAWCLFVALPVENQLQATLQQVMAPLQQQWSEVRWLPASGWHLTMAYIGQSTEQDKAKLISSVKYCAVAADSFAVQIDGWLQWPAQQPRVLALRVQSTEVLLHLHDQLIQQIQQQHLAVDIRPFEPHISVARFNKSHVLPEDIVLPTLSCAGMVQKLALWHSQHAVGAQAHYVSVAEYLLLQERT